MAFCAPCRIVFTQQETKLSSHPEGEQLRNAVKWISEQRQEGQTDDKKLVGEAALKFNLSPMEADYLQRLLKEGEGA